MIQQLLQAEQIHGVLCADGESLIAALAQNASAAVITEEVLGGGFDAALGAFLARQPAWSDFPFVILAMRQSGRRSKRALASLRELGNLVLLERPVNPDTLIRAIQSAQRARRRQYATREHLRQIEESKATVERLNTQLEARIAARTADLANANDRLMRESAERERMQANAVQSQKLEAIGRLTGGIAHDFNNLLHAVNMNVQFIMRLTTDPRLTDYARRARASIDRGSRLTGQLLSFARSGSLLRRPHDINALIANLQELIEISVGAKIQVEMRVAAEPLWVKLDGSQLEMALLNLAVNARDAMEDGGHLVIDTQARTDPNGQALACVTVRDTGTGIPEALLTRVFDPFFTTKANGEGTGLGLSQVYGFAQQSGGSAEISSAPGQGTVVSLRFPITQPGDEVDEFGHEGTAESGSTAEARRRAEILVVEDDAEVRHGIVEGLRLMDYKVREACNGEDGLAQIERNLPDLLMVDYLMPGMTGAELVARSRSLYPQLPVLMETGYADMAEVEKVIGVESVLKKPFDMETLNRAVKAALVGQPATNGRLLAARPAQA